MSFEGEQDSGSVVARVASANFTRRGFLGAAAAVPVAAQAELFLEKRFLISEEVDLDFSNTEGLLKVAIQEGLSRERQAFWSRLGISTVAQARPEDDAPGEEENAAEPRTGPVWSIETGRFGPVTKVRFRNHETGAGRKRYTVTLRDALEEVPPRGVARELDP